MKVDLSKMNPLQELNNLSEEQLCRLAENSNIDSVANTAMRLLRDKHDKTYGWCYDCDGLVVKHKECCMNKTDEFDELDLSQI
jgi:hypothetical protein